MNAQDLQRHTERIAALVDTIDRKLYTEPIGATPRPPCFRPGDLIFHVEYPGHQLIVTGTHGEKITVRDATDPAWPTSDVHRTYFRPWPSPSPQRGEGWGEGRSP